MGEWDCLYVWGLTPTEKNSLEECGKLRQKAQTQNISHIIETTQAKTACYFLLVGRNGRAQMEWAWKLQVRIREARAQAKSLFRVSGRHRYFTRKSRRKKKEKGLVNTDLNHWRTWIKLWPLSSTGFLYLELVSVSQAKLFPFYYVRGLECRRVDQQRWFPGPNGSSLLQLQSVHHLPKISTVCASKDVS